MARVWDSVQVLETTSRRLKHVGGKAVRSSDVELVWERLGSFVEDQMGAGKAVVVPKFGAFTFAAPPPGSLKRKPQSTRGLAFARDFLDECGVRAREHFKASSKTPTRLNYLALARWCRRDRDLCRAVVEGVLWTVATALTQGAARLELVWPRLGTLTCVKGSISFSYDGGAPAAATPEPSSGLGPEHDGHGDELYGAWGPEDAYYGDEAVQPQEYQPASPQTLAPSARAEQFRADEVSRVALPVSLDRLREKAKQRGADGVHALSRMLRRMDTSGDGALSKEELVCGLQKHGIRLNKAEVDEIFTCLDRDRNGTISRDEFMSGLRGPMSKRRLLLVREAFKRMDVTGDGVVTVEDLEVNYDASADPDVKAGRKTPAQALRALLDSFDQGNKDGMVERGEFEEYYRNVSATIDEDDYFELMMRNAWHISGGKGWCANTSNRRVLVTLADGSQRVEEVQNDLYVDRQDDEAAQRHLAGRGVAAQGPLGSAYGMDATSGKLERSRAPKRLSGNATAPRPRRAAADPFANAAADGGDEAVYAPRAAGSGRVQRSKGSSWAEEEEEDKKKEKDPKTLMAELQRVISSRRLSTDDFLLKLGANRVFGEASIRTDAFVRGLTRFEPSISTEDATAMARVLDADRSGSINVPELCAQIKGLGAVARIKAAVLSRGGANGIASLSRILRIMDDSGDKNLDHRELAEGLKDMGVKLSSSEVQDVFAYFDKDRNGKISVSEFLVGMRGNMSKRRRDLVRQAFRLLDTTGDGVVSVEDLESVYDTSRHPDCISGRKSRQQVLRELLDNFDSAAEKDGIVTDEEFADYYSSISAGIDDDDYFELMMRNAWHISGGKGQYENTSNRRVLVTGKDGRQEVREVKNDLWVSRDDTKAMRERLGAAADDELGFTYGTDTRAGGSAAPRDSREARVRAHKVAKRKEELRKAKARAAHRKSGGLEAVSSAEAFERLGPGPRAPVGAWGASSDTFAGAAAEAGDEAAPPPLRAPAAAQLRPREPREPYASVRSSAHGSQSKNSKPAAQRAEQRTMRTRLEPKVLALLRQRVVARGGSAGIHTLGRVLRIMDDSGDGALDREELRYGLQDYGVECTPAMADELFAFLDRDGSGKVSFDEFLAGLRGPIPKRRLALIRMAFERLDRTGDGVVTVEDLEGVYDPSFSPEVRSGKLTKAQALRDFLRQFDTIEQDGIVTEEEFAEYYKNVSASIDDDNYFELMMRNAWHISGGQGQSANTSNRRVLVRGADGRESVREVEDDLWMDRGDSQAMRERLGVSKDTEIGLTYGTDQTRPARRQRKPRTGPSPGKAATAAAGQRATISLAWEDAADRKGVSLSQLERDLKRGKERERQVRAGAAARVQALARAQKAKKATALERRKAQAQQREADELRAERQAASRRIIRPGGSNWY